MTTSNEKYCKQTGRAEIVDFFSGDSTRRYNAFKWGGLLLLASILLPLLFAGCVDVAPTITGPRYSAAGAVPLTGTGLPGSLVEILDGDGNRIDKTTVDQNGTWTTIGSFDPGDHDLQVRAISRMREASNADYPLVLAQGADGRGTLTAYDLGQYALSLPSGDLTPGLLTLTGAGIAGTVVKLFANGVEIGETTVGPDGTWSFDADLADVGDYEINGEVYDADGNLLGAIPTQNLTLMGPALAPLVASGLTAGTFTTADGTTASGPISWSGTGTPGSVIELYANGEKIGETVVDADGNWSFDEIDADLDIDTNQFSVRMLDEDGNLIGEAVNDELLLTADSVSVVEGSSDGDTESGSVEVAPFLVSGSPSAGTFTTADGKIASGPVTWSGFGEPGHTVELWANGVKVGETVIAEDGTWSFDGLDLDLNIADNDLTVQMVDGDGNVVGEPVTETLALNADTVVDESGAGAVTINVPTVNDSGVATLSGTAEPGSTVTLYVNGEPIGTVEADENGKWSLEGYLPAGDHTIQAVVLDENGEPVAESDEVPLSVAGAAPDGVTPSPGRALVRVLSKGDLDAIADGTFDDRFLNGGAAISMILDASWSMTLPTDSDAEEDRLAVDDPNNRINIARKEMINLVTNTIPEGTPVSLRSLGNRGGSLACVTDLEYPLQGMNRADIVAALEDVEPGFNTNTPLAATLSNVPQDLADAGDRERLVILLTDGDERCGGDVEGAINALTASGINVKLNIIGFAINDDGLRAKLEKWAELGNGVYFDAGDSDELSSALTGSLSAVYQLFDTDGANVATGVVGAEPVEVDPGVYKIRIASADGVTEGMVVVPADSTVQITTE